MDIKQDVAGVSEMSERVGKAIMDRIAEYGIRLSGPIQEDVGQIAIAAMREPTDEMIASGDCTDPHGGCDVDCRNVWESMIDEALR